MFGYLASNAFTASAVPGVHAQTVMLAGFLSSAAMLTCLVELPLELLLLLLEPPPPPHAATTDANDRHTANVSAVSRYELFLISSSPVWSPPRAARRAPGHPMLSGRARRPQAGAPRTARRARPPGPAPLRAPRTSSTRTAGVPPPD